MGRGREGGGGRRGKKEKGGGGVSKDTEECITIQAVGVHDAQLGENTHGSGLTRRDRGRAGEGRGGA